MAGGKGGISSRVCYFEIIKYTKAWLMKQDQKTLEGMIQPGFLKRAAVAAMAIITLGAATPAKAADLGVVYKQNPQGQTKSESVMSVGNGVYNKDGQQIGIRSGNVFRDKEGKEHIYNDLNPKPNIYGAQEDYEALAQKDPQQAIDMAGKELQAGNLILAEGIYTTLSQLYLNKKIKLNNNQINYVNIGLYNIDNVKKGSPHLYK
jgi:hypothetical protein